MTHGTFVVTDILGWDEINEFVWVEVFDTKPNDIRQVIKQFLTVSFPSINSYYMATKEEEPGVRHLYRIPFTLLSPLLRQPECLSCLEFPNETNPCQYNEAHFSPEFDFFVLECQGPGLPRTFLFSTQNSEEVTGFFVNVGINIEYILLIPVLETAIYYGMNSLTSQAKTNINTLTPKCTKYIPRLLQSFWTKYLFR